ncbi:hypothetical protein [Tardiphaga sp. P9-11]|jgi:hypothetical protein|uniref:hypothetical protein n=1 Tax=Tardiphaga sp. P9-11 TaxID=2024614 RepID=UPI0011F394FF|nr:hypothetical protein [Tardiphaga sp. P9-11]KAA0078099.1 hypothetical protein CIW50_03475 [Tardiphaga sp. P9-11]
MPHDLDVPQLDSHDLDPLILDLLEWIAREPRSHADVLDAWRTSCPRLTVWEDCIDRGFATRMHITGHGSIVQVTAAGLSFLQRHGRVMPKAPALTTATSPAAS